MTEEMSHPKGKKKKCFSFSCYFCRSVTPLSVFVLLSVVAVNKEKIKNPPGIEKLP